MYVFTFIKRVDGTPQGINISDQHTVVIFSDTAKEALSGLDEDLKRHGLDVAYSKFPKNLQKMFFPSVFLEQQLEQLAEGFLDDEPQVNDDQITLNTEEGYIKGVQKNSLMKKIIETKSVELFHAHIDEFSEAERLYIHEKIV